MPIHPFHWGVPGLADPLTRGRLDLFALLLGATLPDIDVVWVAFAEGRVGHGFLHTFPGIVVVAIMVTLYLPFRDRIRKLPFMHHFVDEMKRPWTLVFFSGLVGAWTHNIMDAILYQDINPYMTSPINPFYVPGVRGALYLFLALSLLAFVAWLLHKKFKGTKRPQMDILEFDKWTKLGALLMVTGILITGMMEANAPSPLGQIRIYEVYSEETYFTGNSIVLHGRINYVKGITHEELEVEITWRGGSIRPALSSEDRGYRFFTAVQPLEPGEHIELVLFLAGGTADIRATGNRILYRTSFTVPQRAPPPNDSSRL
ncbi:MAG: DUF4184 family protein [Candidatus Thermoplasmatota archaeon]|nr:DUF4184 family protein [Candidatus Thermoplasmatota archaeon]